MCKVKNVNEGPSAKPFDLEEEFGEVFRIVKEESWHVEKPEVRSEDKRWYDRIPCRGGGFIGLCQEEPIILLELYTPMVKRARMIWKAIKDIPYTRADFHQEGEAVIYFPPECLEKVARMANARRKRRATKALRAHLQRIGAATQFQPQDTA